MERMSPKRWLKSNGNNDYFSQKVFMCPKFFLISIALLMGVCGWSQSENMVTIPGGEYTPLYGNDSAKVKVDPFELDVYPVTNAEYQIFLKTNPKWHKDSAVALFVDANYLNQFDADGNLKPGENPNGPVTNVSWFAAKAYCKCQRQRLPTMDEWEFVAESDTASPDARKKEGYNQYILRWYETPHTHRNSIGSTFKNYYGVYDMHGLIWEWTQDFNSILLTGESRGDVKNSNARFCGGASLGASDLRDYAAFMRYAFRGALKGNYSVQNLGFRCAKDIPVK